MISGFWPLAFFLKHRISVTGQSSSLTILASAMILPRTFPLVCLLACASGGMGLQSAFSHDHDTPAPPPPAQRRTHVDVEELAKQLNAAQAERPATMITLPPVPIGVEELRFQDFYKLPVGPRGLEPTHRLLSLNGKRVRILGYMAEIQCTNNREIIFSPVPLQPQPEEYGLCDDIPATHILVTVPGNPNEPVRHVSGPILLTGLLAVGDSSKSGESSFVRMQLDAPATAKVTQPK